MEVAGEDGLRDLLGEADIEPIDAAATSEVYRPKQFAVGMKLDDPLSASGSEKLFGQSQRLEYLQRTRVNDGRSIPVERPRLGIDQMTWHPSAAQLGSEQQAGWARADYQHCGFLDWLAHRRQGGPGTLSLGG